MVLAKVVGNVVSTSKNEKLIGKKLMVIEFLDRDQNPNGNTEVAIDSCGAGIGETVIVCKGSTARSVFDGDAPIDSAIVGIVDTIEVV